jgi:hypothetical protein
MTLAQPESSSSSAPVQMRSFLPSCSPSPATGSDRMRVRALEWGNGDHGHGQRWQSRRTWGATEEAGKMHPEAGHRAAALLRDPLLQRLLPAGAARPRAPPLPPPSFLLPPAPAYSRLPEETTRGTASTLHATSTLRAATLVRARSHRAGPRRRSRMCSSRRRHVEEVRR